MAVAVAVVVVVVVVVVDARNGCPSHTPFLELSFRDWSANQHFVLLRMVLGLPTNIPFGVKGLPASGFSLRC